MKVTAGAEHSGCWGGRGKRHWGEAGPPGFVAVRVGLCMGPQSHPPAAESLAAATSPSWGHALLLGKVIYFQQVDSRI